MPERIVVDTNVIVSTALRKDSVPRKVLSFLLKHEIVLISEETLTELDEVLRRPKLNKYSRIEDRINFLRALISKATLVQVSTMVADCSDLKDNKFLELALDGNATHIISGDNDLLTMDPYRGIKIISPAQFINIFPEKNIV